jgi:hypothetical protein
MRYETYFYRAQRLWQPILAKELRGAFVVGKWGERVRSRLTKKQMKALMQATHISDIDKIAVVVYHGFRNLDVSYASRCSWTGETLWNVPALTQVLVLSVALLFRDECTR